MEQIHGARLESVLQDVRYGWRSILRSPGFAAVVVLTLSLGIGVNTAIFSVFHAVLLAPFPYERPEQLALVWSQYGQSGANRAPTSGVIFDQLRRRTTQFQDFGGIWVGGGAITGDDHAPEQIKIGNVTSNFFDVLGAKAWMGRTFVAEERAGGRSAIVLSHGLWQRRFGRDPSVVGKQVWIDGQTLTIVGVMPEKFQVMFPPDANVPPDMQAWMPFSYPIEQGPLTLYFIRVLARMKPGVTLGQAQTDATSAANQIRAAYPKLQAAGLQFHVAPLHADAVRDVKPALVALFAGAGMVLAICCVNLANLVLARAGTRRKEIAVRASLGASGGRIMQQLFVEGLLLCALAGLAGLALGWWGIQILQKIRPEQSTWLRDVALNWQVLGFAAAMSMLPALLFTLAPALEAAKERLVETLREAGRQSRAPLRRRLRTALIASEIMFGFLLLVGAGLMMRTLDAIQRTRPGFDKERLLTFAFDLPWARYGSNADRTNFVRLLEEKLRAIGGVEAAGAVSHLPLDDYPNWYSPYRPEGKTREQSAGLLADHRASTPGYLQAMGARLSAGRYFDEQDNAGGQQVVIVDEIVARRTWPGESAVGKRIEVEQYHNGRFEPGTAVVVGVVEHIQHHGLTKRLRGQIYIPYAQSSRPHLSYAVRTRREPIEIAGQVRNALAALDRNLPVSQMRPMTSFVARATEPASFTTVLAVLFGALALALAAIGVYGVISYSVTQRTHEMGVRMALGASRRDVVRLVMGEGMAITACGLALGVIVTLAVSRWLEALVFGVAVTDPLTYAAAGLAVSATAIAASWRPAMKAALANPVDAIRAD